MTVLLVVVVVVVVVVRGRGVAEGLAVGYVSPRVSPPFVVGFAEGWGEVDAIGLAEGIAEVAGANSKLGDAEAEGEGEADLSGKRKAPVERSIIRPIAPIITAATRPKSVDFMSYIIHYGHDLSIHADVRAR